MKTEIVTIDLGRYLDLLDSEKIAQGMTKYEIVRTHSDDYGLSGVTLLTIRYTDDVKEELKKAVNAALDEYYYLAEKKGWEHYHPIVEPRKTWLAKLFD